jgi:hypothetical protein
MRAQKANPSFQQVEKLVIGIWNMVNHSATKQQPVIHQ